MSFFVIVHKIKIAQYMFNVRLNTTHTLQHQFGESQVESEMSLMQLICYRLKVHILKMVRVLATGMHFVMFQVKIHINL